MAKEVDLIKEKLHVVDFLRNYLTLTPAGRNFKALCPFHQEKTPSFIISPDRGIWHCFGCGEGGDVIKFAMKYENLEFPEALRFLAEKAGIPLRALNPAQERDFGVLYEIHDVAREFFRKKLVETPAAKEYLRERKLNEDTISEFGLGFAPGGESLTLHLLKSGFAIEDIVRAGLSHKNTAGLYRDRFHARIMFPIYSHVGKTVAFTGRILPALAERFDIEPPKYLNSPETPIFNKSRILYGLNKTKMKIAESRTVFLVEGQMDFLSVWQAGIQNIAAVSGTGLTPQHLERLRRIADSVIITFDNDEAGLHALERSLDVFNSFDFHVKVLDLGGYKDPAEACEKDPKFITSAATLAKPAFLHLFHIYFAPGAENLGIAGKKRVIRHLLAKIRNVKSALEQNIWIKELARYSGISEAALNTELQAIPKERVEEAGVPVEGESLLRERIDLIAERLLALAFKEEEHLLRLKERSDWLPVMYQGVLQKDDAQKALASIIEMRSSYEYGDLEKPALFEEFNALMKHLELEVLKRARQRIQEKMKVAELSKNEKESMDAMKEFYEISQKIDALRISL